MSAEHYNEWEEEEEEEFVPGAYDEDDEDDDNVAYDDADDDLGSFPPLLQGDIFVHPSKGLCYEKDGGFCLVCKTSIPAGTFTFETPLIGSPLLFAGWIHDPNRWMEFDVVFSKETASTDPLQIELLNAQEKEQICNGSLTRNKTDVENIDDNWTERKSAAKGSLKAPPSYSSKKNPRGPKQAVDNLENRSRKLKDLDSSGTNEEKMAYLDVSNKRNQRSDVMESNTRSTSERNMVFIVSGAQIGNDGENGCSVSFRGAYRCPTKTSVGRLHLICPIQTLDRSTCSSAVGSTAIASMASSSVASASKKRNRPGNDDDSVEGSVGVAYQELIDLHDDTRLSTEELRNKYYGVGEKKGSHRKQYTADTRRLKVTNDRENKERDLDDDDNDDAYGF